MSKAVKSVTKAVVSPVKKVVSSVNDVRKDVTRAVVPTAVYKPVSKTTQKIGSAVNDVRKNVTRKGLNAVADVVKPLGPAGVPLLTAAVNAAFPGLGIPLAAALAAGATTAGRAIDSGAGLTQAGKSGLLSGGISGLAAYGGQALAGKLSPVLQEQLKGVVSPEVIKNYITPALTSGTIQGGLGSLTGTQSFGRGFLQGAGTSALGAGLEQYLGQQGVADPTARKMGSILLESKLAPALGLAGAAAANKSANATSAQSGDFDIASLLPYLIGGVGGAGLASLFGNKNDTAPAPAGAAPGTPTVPGALNIGQIGQAYVPQQNISYGMTVPATPYTGLVSAPLSAMTKPAYFGG